MPPRFTRRVPCAAISIRWSDNRPRRAGFLAAAVTAHDGVQAAAIDLVGVAIEQQRSGVGRALVRQFAAHYSGCAQIIVGTQAANVPSLRMYEGLGFRAARSTYVLHRHVGVSQS